MSLVSLPVVNTKQNKLGEERIYLTLPHCSPSLKESRTGAPVRNLEVGTGTETLDEHVFSGLLHLFVYNQNHLLWVGVGLLLSVLGPPTSL